MSVRMYGSPRRQRWSKSKLVHTDPATQEALHQVLTKVFGDHGSEVDPAFAELRRRCKDKLRIQDVAAVSLNGSGRMLVAESWR